MPKLDYYFGGFKYRIPTPGATIIQGKVNANIQLPGLTMRYTIDGSEPDRMSRIYTEPVAGRTVKVSAFDSRGRKGKTIVVVNE